MITFMACRRFIIMLTKFLMCYSITYVYFSICFATSFRSKNIVDFSKSRSLRCFLIEKFCEKPQYNWFYKLPTQFRDSLTVRRGSLRRIKLLCYWPKKITSVNRTLCVTVCNRSLLRIEPFSYCPQSITSANKTVILLTIDDYFCE